MKYDLENVTAPELATVLHEPRMFPYDSPQFDLYLTLARLGDRDGRDNGICERLIEWALDANDPMDNSDMPAADLARAMIETLERIDCAAGAGPSRLIYNHNLGAEAGRHWFEINQALDDYRDETGETPSPRDGVTSIGWLVWFAYEWNAHRLASLMRSVFELEE